MSEWWTYRPEDFLLFSPRVYWRMFELQNEALSPLPVATLAAGLVIVLAMLRWPKRGRWIGILLAALWAFVGWSFLWNRYAAINWAIAYVAPIFVLQAVMLLTAAIRRGGLTFDRRALESWVGVLLAAAGLVLYPFLPLLTGRSWPSAEIFGIAPDPTAIVTLGVLLSARSRMLAVLFPIPLFWCLLSGLTLGTMDERQAWLPLLAVAVALAALGLRLARVAPGSRR